MHLIPSTHVIQVGDIDSTDVLCHIHYIMGVVVQCVFVTSFQILGAMSQLHVMSRVSSDMSHCVIEHYIV